MDFDQKRYIKLMKEASEGNAKIEYFRQSLKRSFLDVKTNMELSNNSSFNLDEYLELSRKSIKLRQQSKNFREYNETEYDKWMLSRLILHKNIYWQDKESYWI